MAMSESRWLTIDCALRAWKVGWILLTSETSGDWHYSDIGSEIITLCGQAVQRVEQRSHLSLNQRIYTKLIRVEPLSFVHHSSSCPFPGASHVLSWSTDLESW